jgi:hypothetical protein
MLYLNLAMRNLLLLTLNRGTPIWLNIKVETAASAGTNLVCTLHSSSTTDIDAGTEGTTNHTLWQSGAIPQANLTAGAWIVRIPLPNDADADRYLGIQYNQTGTLTACTVNAWLDHGPQSSFDTQVATSNI